ncbi:MAG: hypothetical protein HWN65_21235 [Candidatus Helarchaeota archaeon]|nr:hypothetical protein [Candidatus Helarchaeota archaeon]
MNIIKEKIIKEIKKKAEEEFQEDPALQQIHIARKIIAKEAEIEGLSYIEYIKKVRQKSKII